MIYIYDKFLDAVLNLQKTTQQKVTEFITKFNENSKSAAIHLESIKIFKDQSLKTARIDQKYRAIIKEVRPSETYLLVWVDNHDEAMDWAKNKRIDWNEDTQAFQVFTMQESTFTGSDAIDSPKLYLNKYSAKDLKKIGVLEILMPSVLNIVDIEGLEQLEQFLPADVFENLFYLLDGASIDLLITEIQEGLTSLGSDKFSSINNRRSFIELTDDSIFNEILLGSLHKWKYYLHPSQSVFVNDNFNGAFKLSGGAGTGKTVVALHRLKYLSENLESDKPILFTTFTKELTANISSLASELNIEQGTYQVDNIDSLVFRLAKQYDIWFPTDGVFEINASESPYNKWEHILENKSSTFDVSFLLKEYKEVILEQDVKTLDEYLQVIRWGRGKVLSRNRRIEL